MTLISLVISSALSLALDTVAVYGIGLDVVDAIFRHTVVYASGNKNTLDNNFAH